MQSTLPLPDRKSGAEWQLLGELEMSGGDDIHAVLEPWLAALVRPLDLPVDFIERLSKSVEESAARALRDPGRQTARHVHLLIFGPEQSASPGQFWGFYRIEKAATRPAAEQGSTHAIAYYLYRERP